MNRAMATVSLLSLVFGSACTLGIDPCMTDGDVLTCSEVCDEGGPYCEDGFEERQLVENWIAEPGDVSACPFSGKVFMVEYSSRRVLYQGHSFVFECEGMCIEIVESDPAYYLDDLVEQAGGPAADPDPADGGTIEDE